MCRSPWKVKAQRWQAVDGGIDEVDQARADVLNRKRKGSHVVPIWPFGRGGSPRLLGETSP